MDSEPKHIERVQRIIALKRYEQPPPGYFHLLPERIMTRIEHGEGKSNFWEKWFGEFSIRPGLAYALGVTVCGAVTVGMFYSTRLDPTVRASEMARATEPWAGPQSAMIAATTPVSAAAHPLHVPNWLGSTNPVAGPQPLDSLFQTQDARVIPVSFDLPR